MMAVDTETKRRSVLGMTIMALTIAPVPDGTIAAVDREHILGLYAGIAPEEPVVEALWDNVTEDNTVSWSGAVENNSVTWVNASENNTVSWSVV